MSDVATGIFMVTTLLAIATIETTLQVTPRPWF